MLARVLKWVVVAVVLAAVVAALAAPQFCKRLLAASIYGLDDAPLWVYKPRLKIAGASSAGMPHVSAEDQQIDPAALKLAAEYAEAHGSRALIVSRRSHLVMELYWDGADGRVLASSGDLSQALTAVMLGIAIGESKIGSVDEPAANYIKEWQSDSRNRIRIRDLAQMSSGLQPLAYGDTRERLFADTRTRDLSRPLEGTPGERWVRQNIDPQMLALVIERATGEPYARYVSDRLWKRLGASDAYFWEDRQGGAPHADCCMLARPGDWMRLAEVLANDGVYLGDEIVRPGWVNQMFTPAKGNPRYGFNVWLNGTSLRTAASAASEADGNSGGAGSRVGYTGESISVSDMIFINGGRLRLWVSPSLRLSILRIGGGRDGKDLSDSRIPNLIVSGLRDYRPPTPSAAEKKIDPSLYAPGH